MKIKLIFLMLFISTLIFGQIQSKKSDLKTFEFGKASKTIYPVGEFYITGYVLNNDTSYSFTYRNSEFTSLVSFESIYINNKKSLEDFYEILKSVFKEENKSNKDYVVIFNLGKDEVRVSYNYVGKGSCFVNVKNKGYCQITEKTLEKLFNR